MSRKFKKYLSLVLISSFLVTTGCSTGVTTDSQISDSETKENDSISFLTNFGIYNTEVGLDSWAETYEGMTGIDVTIDSLSGTEYYQMLDFTLAMGRASDVVAIAEGKLPFYVADGDLLDLTELAANSEIINSIPSEYLEAAKIDGRLYGIPVEFGGGTITYVRQDLLDELDMSHPTNYDEFITLLRAIKEKYPNMIPYTAPGLIGNSSEYYLIDFYQDANPEIIEVDGKWVDGLLEDNMINALKRLRDAYAEGLIDVEIASNGTKQAREKFMTGKAAVFNYWAGNWYNNIQTNLTKNLGGKATASPIKPIKNVKYMIRPPVVLSITSSASNPESTFTNFLEFMHDGGKGSMLFQHGVEGIHYEIRDNEIVHKEINEQVGTVAKAFVDPAAAIISNENYTYKIEDQITYSLNLLKEYGEQQYNIPSSNTYATISSEITELKLEAISDIMVGAISIEDGLVRYKEKAEALGMSKALAEMNA